MNLRASQKSKGASGISRSISNDERLLQELSRRLKFRGIPELLKEVSGCFRSIAGAFRVSGALRELSKIFRGFPEAFQDVSDTFHSLLRVVSVCQWM